jgi:hypothetical protein
MLTLDNSSRHSRHTRGGDLMKKPIVIIIQQEHLQNLRQILVLILKILVLTEVLLYGPGILGIPGLPLP